MPAILEVSWSDVLLVAFSPSLPENEGGKIETFSVLKKSMPASSVSPQEESYNVASDIDWVSCFRSVPY